MFNNQQITILLAEAYTLVREALKLMIERQDDLHVIGEASDGHQLVQMYRELQPDLVLLELKMPDQCGVEVIQSIRDLDAEAKILILTTFDGDEDIYSALKAGARGYLLKDIPQQQFFEAIRAVNTGKRYIPSEIATKLAEYVSEIELTDREKAVLRLLAEGLSNKGIADQLYISEGTVKTHVNHILAKLSAKSRTEAAAIATQRGLLR